MLTVDTQPACKLAHCTVIFRKIRSSHISLTDRTGLSPLGWENFGWVAARPQPKRRIKCETPVACEKLHFAISLGPLPLYFTQKTHTKTQNQTFPDLPEWVRSADAGRTTQPPAETQIYLTYWRGGSGGQYIFGLIRSQLWLSPFRIGADLSLLPCHVFGVFYLTYMLAGALGSFCPFSADCKIEPFSPCPTANLPIHSKKNYICCGVPFLVAVILLFLLHDG